VRVAGTPAHLLFLDHPLADDLVDGELRHRAGGDLTAAIRSLIVTPLSAGEQRDHPTMIRNMRGTSSSLLATNGR
jgi:hypothetical protein